MKPVLSAIITTYNRQDLLVKAIQSVLLQDFSQLEIVVIDDASKEDVQSLLQNKFPQEISAEKLRCYRNQVNSERSFSRNLGMQKAQGDFFAFLDDDDIWLPFHAREILEFFSDNPDVGLVITNYFNETENGKKSVVYQGIKTGKGVIYRDRCINRMLVSGSIYAIKKEVFEKLGGFISDLEPAEDREYLSKIAMNFNVGYIAKPSVAKFTHRGSFAYKTSLSRHAVLKEKVWLAVEENSSKFGYPLKRSIFCDWYLHLAVNFLPDLEKAGFYLNKAIKAYPWCLIFPTALGLLFKVMVGARLYKGLKKVNLLFHKN